MCKSDLLSIHFILSCFFVLFFCSKQQLISPNLRENMEKGSVNDDSIVKSITCENHIITISKAATHKKARDIICNL